VSLNLAVLLRESARRDPPHTAIICGEAELSYEDLHSRAQRLAAGLARLGVRRGDHVALMLPNVPEFTVAYFAVLYLGAAVVPINVLLTRDEIGYLLEDSKAVAVIAWHTVLGPVTAALGQAIRKPHLVTAGGSGAIEGINAPGLEKLIEESTDLADLTPTMPDDTAVILYTSGTTGRPKGAELTHFNMFYNAEYGGTRLVPMNGRTIALGALPLFHSFGQTMIQNAVLGRGGTVVLMARFDAQAALETMARRSVTLFAGVPTMYFALLRAPGAASQNVSLEYALSGGSAMPVEVLREFDRAYRVNILEGYGLSETSPVASFNLLDRPRKVGSIGVPIEGVEFRLVDNDGRIVTEPGVPGEIGIRGHNVMKGYFGQPEATAEAMKDGWLLTGDIAHRDEDGYYFIVDRKKDMIIRGGFNVYPREVEEVLYAHPAVAEAAVVGVPHESHGEEVKAFVARKPGATVTEQEIVEFCRERLAAYKYPRLVEFRDTLPKGPTGKILKRELRS
jgi:long-chain acyl-CoA synthetase